MRYIFLWIAVLGVGIGAATWAQAAGDAASNYSSLCSSCHGPGGKGNGPAAAALNPKPRDFSDCKVMAKDTDDMLFKAIKGGGQSIGRSAMMVSWGGALTDEQIHDLVSYVRAFCKK
jgi:mono/diheme cytochrome c family protein